MIRVPVKFGGLFTSLDATQIPPNRAFETENVFLDNGILELDLRDNTIGQWSTPDHDYSGDVGYGLGYGRQLTNTTYQLVITGGVPTSGHVTLTFPVAIGGGGTSGNILFNATAAQISAVLGAMSIFSDGQYSVSGGPFPNQPVLINISGNYSGQSFSNLTVASSTLNNSASCVPTVDVAGGQQDEYEVILLEKGNSKATLFSVTSADGYKSTNWNPDSTSLNPSDWYCQQIADKVYMTNQTDGITFKQLGGLYSGPVGIPGVSNPVSGPSVSVLSTYPGGFPVSGTGTAGTYSGWGSNPTPTYEPTSILFALNTNITTTTQVSFVFTLTAGATDLSKQDKWTIYLSPSVSTFVIDPTSIQFTMNNAGGSINPDQQDAGQTGAIGVPNRNFYFNEGSESARQTTLSFTLKFNIVSAANTNSLVVTFGAGDVWMNDTMAGLNLLTGPTINPIRYAYSYYQWGTQMETPLSPIVESVNIPITASDSSSAYGNYVSLTAPVSAGLTSSDYIKFYRYDSFGLPRLIGISPNTGTPSASDAYMADELNGFSTFGQITLPGGLSPTTCGFWKGSFLVSSNRKMFMSYVGIPNEFAPDPSQFGALYAYNLADANAPRTVYVSGTRSEPVYGMIGDDSIYITTDRGTYAMVNGVTAQLLTTYGPTSTTGPVQAAPNSLNPPLPLPGAMGSLGPRATCGWQSGIIVASPTGAWFYSVSSAFTGTSSAGTMAREELTLELRSTWQSFISGNIFDTTGSSIVATFWDEELWFFNGFLYLHRSRNGHWTNGVLYHPNKATWTDPYNGLISITGLGTLVKMLPYSMTEAAINWSYTSGIIDIPRHSALDHFEAWYSVASVNGALSITVNMWDVQQTMTTQTFNLYENPGGIFWFPTNLVQGMRYQVSITGGPQDTVTSLTLAFNDSLPQPVGN